METGTVSARANRRSRRLARGSRRELNCGTAFAPLARAPPPLPPGPALSGGVLGGHLERVAVGVAVGLAVGLNGLAFEAAVGARAHVDRVGADEGEEHGEQQQAVQGAEEADAEELLEEDHEDVRLGGGEDEHLG